MSPEARSLIEIAQNLLDAALALDGDDANSKTRLSTIQLKLDFTLKRLGVGGLDEKATRNAINVMLGFAHRQAKKMGGVSATMRELNTIMTFESELSKSLIDWLAGRQP